MNLVVVFLVNYIGVGRELEFHGIRKGFCFVNSRVGEALLALELATVLFLEEP